MNARSREFGSATTLLALAVVVSLGSVTDVQAGVALAQLRPEVRAQVASDRDAVVQFLCEAVRLFQLDNQRVGPAAVLTPPNPDVAGPLVVGLMTPTVDTLPPPAPPATHLIDMPPPA